MTSDKGFAYIDLSMPEMIELYMVQKFFDASSEAAYMLHKAERPLPDVGRGRSAYENDVKSLCQYAASSLKFPMDPLSFHMHREPGVVTLQQLEV